jgi:hypothetical protein
MSRESGDIASQLRDLAGRALNQQVRSNQRFADLLKRIAAGELDNQQVRDEFRHFSENETSEYIRTLTNMGVSFFSSLLDLNQGFNERFFQRLGRQTHDPGAGVPPEAHGKLSLGGPVRSTLLGRFVVENRRGTESDVSMVISPVKREDGSSFQAPFVVQPAAFRLAAGEERAVELSLQLLKDLFVPGGHYSCQVLVRGPENMLLDLAIAVDPEASPGPTAASGGESGHARAEARAAAKPKPGKRKAASVTAKRQAASRPPAVKKEAAKSGAKKARSTGKAVRPSRKRAAKQAPSS